MPERQFRIWAAGSLQAPLGRFLRLVAPSVQTRFGPSGRLRAEIEADPGAAPDLFLSADTGHPQRLVGLGLAPWSRVFAGNTIVALTRPGLALRPEGLLAALADPALRIATSQPLADPSGDYAFAVFDRAEALHPGLGPALRARVLVLAGHPAAPRPPDGGSPYAHVLRTGLADLFLTYRSNALAALAEMPGLGLVTLPPGLSVDATFALCPLGPPDPACRRMVGLLMSPVFAEQLRAFGFTTAIDRQD